MKIVLKSWESNNPSRIPHPAQPFALAYGVAD